MPTLNLTLLIHQSCGLRDGCSDVLNYNKKAEILSSKAVKLIFPETTLTTDRQLKEISLKNSWNTAPTRVCSYTGSLTMRPQSIILTYTGTLRMRLHSIIISNLYTRFSNSTNYHLRLPRPRIDTFETSIAFTHTFFPTLRTVNIVRLGQG